MPELMDRVKLSQKEYVGWQTPERQWTAWNSLTIEEMCQSLIIEHSLDEANE
jgi:hypothetical protein